MATVAPPHGLEQSMRALDRGQEIRLRRVGLKRRIHGQGRAGAAIAAEVLRKNPDWLHTLDVGEFLLWVPYFGKREARKLLDFRRVNPWCELDELSTRQRRLLVADLLAFAGGERRQVSGARGHAARMGKT